MLDPAFLARVRSLAAGSASWDQTETGGSVHDPTDPVGTAAVQHARLGGGVRGRPHPAADP